MAVSAARTLRSCLPTGTDPGAAVDGSSAAFDADLGGREHHMEKEGEGTMLVRTLAATAFAAITASASAGIVGFVEDFPTGDANWRSSSYAESVFILGIVTGHRRPRTPQPEPCNRSLRRRPRGRCDSFHRASQSGGFGHFGRWSRSPALGGAARPSKSTAGICSGYII